MDKACIFIDGENLRFSISRLFPKDYKTDHYLPYADWNNLFQKVIVPLTARKIARDLNLIRVYWYVVSDIQYDDYFTSQHFRKIGLDKKIKYFKKACPSLKDEKFNEESCIEQCSKLLNRNADYMKERLNSWKKKESEIQKKTNKLQYQQFGYLKVKLDDGSGKAKPIEEKGVDIKLATDLISLKDIYDIAIIVSGDGDYIPAVMAIKNMGKQVVVVDFKDRKNKFLPGGSRKLKEHCDFTFSILHETMLDICRYGLAKEDPPREINLSCYDF